MDGLNHYRKVASELIRLYEFITDRHFPVIAPRSVFLTTEQLEKLEKFPPAGGLSRFTRRMEVDVSIEKIMHAYEIGGDTFEMGFKYPKRDIPIIYEAVQEYIRLWVDIKINAVGYNTATVDELRALERVSRSLFGIYKYYREEEEEERLKGNDETTDYGLANVALSLMQFGSGEAKGLSFISYIDQYHDKLKSSNDTYTMYLDRHRYDEPERQKNITDMFKAPTMQHDLGGNWN